MLTSCISSAETDEKNIQRQFWTAVALCAALWALLVLGTIMAR